MPQPAILERAEQNIMQGEQMKLSKHISETRKQEKEKARRKKEIEGKRWPASSAYANISLYTPKYE